MNKKIKNSRIFLAGHTGMVGSSILRVLKKKNIEKFSQFLAQNLI